MRAFVQSGWDTMRMYEILAAGCVPIFAGLHLSPRGGAMAFLPWALLEMAQRLPGVRLNESVALQKYTSTTGTSEDSPPPLSVDASQFDDTAFRDVAYVSNTFFSLMNIATRENCFACSVSI